MSKSKRIVIGARRRLYLALNLGRVRRLERLCLFVGNNRCGSTLVGALLNAHPEIAVAGEYDLLEALRLRPAGPARALLLRSECLRIGNQQRRGFISTGYRYAVPGCGPRGRVRVACARRAEKTANAVLRDGPRALRAAERLGLPLRLICVTRNPYDRITTTCVRLAGRARIGPMPGARQVSAGKLHARLAAAGDAALFEKFLPVAIDKHIAEDGAVQAVLDEGRYPLFFVRYEDFTAHPRARLRELTEFLGVACRDSHLDAAAAVVRPASRTRDLLSALWTDARRARMQAHIERHAWLRGYAFEDAPPQSPKR